MAIFGESNKLSDSNVKTTVITTGFFVKGEVKLTCSIYIDGKIEGSLDSTSDITIGKSGCVVGNVFAKKVLVQGCLEGEIDADRVEILSEGVVKGTIISSELVIEANSSFEGESKKKNTNLLKDNLDDNKKRTKIKDLDNLEKN